MPIVKNFEDNYLDNAEQQTLARGLYDIPIVDCDCHYMSTPWAVIAEYLDEPWRSRIRQGAGAARNNFIPHDMGDRTAAGRMKTYDHYFSRQI